LHSRSLGGIEFADKSPAFRLVLQTHATFVVHVQNSIGLVAAID